MTLDTAALDAPNRMAVSVTVAPAKRAPAIYRVRISDKSPILQ